MRADEDRQYVEYVSSRLPWIRKVAYLLCQDWHRADDLCQIAITRLYVHWRTASRAESLDAYVRTIVVRVFLSERRGGWASRVQLNGGAEVEPAGYDVDSTTRLAFQQALVDVPDRQRAALVLRYYCDLSVEEAAQVLRCSTGNVKSQTARGLVALRRALEARQIVSER